MLSLRKIFIPILFTTLSFSTTIHVATTGSDDTGDGSENNPYATIQKGIDMSLDGDTVFVSAGIYTENINYSGKNISIIGESRETTIIDGNQNGSVVTFENGENETTLLKHFMITNSGGLSNDWGGGIYVRGGSTPFLDSLIIDGNTGGGYGGSDGGGGLCVINNGSRADISNSIITNTTSESESGALFACQGGEIKATNCLIVNNNTSGVSAGCNSGSGNNTIELINCTITDNNGLGIYIFGEVFVSNSIIFNNGWDGDQNIEEEDIGTITVTTSLVQGGYDGEGNIDGDPLFCDPENGDYSLAENSPAVGSGENGSNIGALGIGCEAFDTAIHVATNGSDDTGDGSIENPYATIQKGINESIDGDTVFVAEGTYEENINYNGKNISIIGEDRETTIIDGNNGGRVVTFNNGEDNTAVLSGFSIMFGQGGIEVINSSPTLRDLFIAYNQINDYANGAGISATGSNLVIEDCELYFNTGAFLGGGIFFNDTESDLTNVTIAFCSADSADAIFIATDCNIDLINCTFYSGGIMYGNNNQFSIKNCIYWYSDYGYFLDYDGSENFGSSNNNICTISFSLIKGMSANSSFYSHGTLNWDEETNINENPLFCFTNDSDFTLAENSPAVGTGEDGADMGAFGVGCGRIAQTIHVSTTGSDETGNGSEQNPYATIEKANYEVDYYYNENYASEAIEWIGITVSDTILVHDGTYEIDNLIGGYDDYSDNVTIIASLNGPNSTFLLPEENAGGIGNTLAFYDISGFTLTGMNFFVYASFISFKNCIIRETAEFSASSCHLYCFVFEKTTFINNNSNDNNGYDLDLPFFNNSIILNNEGLDDVDTDNTSFTLNDLGLNENGNITDLNPLFCDPENGDYSLAENSPAVGAGEDGVDMGALGVGCETIELAPIISEIDDQQINEDGSISIEVSATSEIGATMIFTALSDTSDVALSLDNSTLTANPSPDWNGIASIMVIVTDENDLSDSTSFSLNVAPVNDSPEDFNVLYPTVSDTFSTHMDSDTVIAFLWEESHDIDSDVTYTLTIEFEFFGNIYSDVHESIEDTIFSVSSNSLNPILDATAQDIAVFNYYVHSTDGDFVVLSSLGEFVVSRESLSLSDGFQLPMVYALHQNYPNPFNPVTTLQYELPEDSFVNITIYDMLGNVVSNLVNKSENSGYKSVQWHATNNQGQPVSAGVYLYSIETGDFRSTKKMVLLK